MRLQKAEHRTDTRSVGGMSAHHLVECRDNLVFLLFCMLTALGFLKCQGDGIVLVGVT